LPTLLIRTLRFQHLLRKFKLSDASRRRHFRYTNQLAFSQKKSRI
jgi:hypothetical protein